MPINDLKQKVRERSYWKSEDSMLPKGNLTRSGYLGKLDRLREVNVITSIMGQRRCGKSVIGRQYIKKMREEGIPKQNILYLNFFLKPLAEAREEINFIPLIQWWMDQCVDKKLPSLLVLDEVQELENWEANVASLFEDPLMPCRIIITGSNSKMLTDDFAGRLGGRYTTLQVFPFSFSEFCQFRGLETVTANIETYLAAGGMPEVLKTEDEEQKTRLISDIVNSTVKQDIVLRYNPSNPGLLYALIDYCRVSFSQEFSVKSITRTVLLKSGFKKRNGTRSGSTSSLISSYIGYMRDVYFLYTPLTYSHRTKEILKREIDKIYLSDLCLADYQVQTQKGRLLENMVYLELLRHDFKVMRYLGYRNRNLEIDFLVEKGNRAALIQVCWMLGDEQENKDLWKREFGNLHLTKKEVPKIVVSLDERVVSPYADVGHLNIIRFFDWMARF